MIKLHNLCKEKREGIIIGNRIILGCFVGTLEESIKAIKTKYTNKLEEDGLKYIKLEEKRKK